MFGRHIPTIYTPHQGYCYEHGVGVEQDASAAFRWIQSAAEKGHPASQHLLATYYRVGTGCEVDNDLAARWYRKSADQGDPDGQSMMGKFRDVLASDDSSWKLGYNSLPLSCFLAHLFLPKRVNHPFGAWEEGKWQPRNPLSCSFPALGFLKSSSIQPCSSDRGVALSLRTVGSGTTGGKNSKFGRDV